MDTKSLELFVSVAQQQSISKAADQKHLTQSAVSKRIAQLEAQLNTELFERHNRRLSLTESGEVLLIKAQKILDLLDETQQTIESLNDDMHGRLCIAASHHIGLHRLPPSLLEFKTRYPNIELNLQFMASEQASDALEKRQIDFALITLEASVNEAFEQQILWQDELIPTCAYEHALAHKKQIGLNDLCKHTAILPEQNTSTFNLINAHFLKQNRTLKLAMATNYLETIKMMVTVGLGWSFLPEAMLDNKLKRLDWSGQNPSRKLGVLKLKNRPLSNKAQAFIKLLTSPDLN